MKSRVAAVIPARLASTRFPGKPLFSIRGLPMIEHVRRRALLCGLFSEVIVSTCDQEIAQSVQRYGGRCILTSPSHAAATDRVSEAARKLDCTHVVNVQGDEILVTPSDLAKMVSEIQARPEVPAWNAVASLESPEEISDSSVVKCAVSLSGRILFCSRDFSGLQGQEGMNGSGSLRRIVGILGYRFDFLERYGSLQRTPLEVAHSIDQLRVIEYDIALQGVEFSRGFLGINEPREVKIVESYLEKDLQQRTILKEVLAE